MLQMYFSNYKGLTVRLINVRQYLCILAYVLPVATSMALKVDDDLNGETKKVSSQGRSVVVL